MSARTADTDGDDLSPVPEGWERTEPGSPLLESVKKEKVALQWCPAPQCGPEGEVFEIVGQGGRSFDHHLEEVHAGRPRDFGLSPLHDGSEDYRVDEFGGDGDG